VEQSKIFAGIDPGLGGGWAEIHENGSMVNAGRMPLITVRGKKVVNVKRLAHLISFADHVVIENVHAMPGQGVSSSFTFGMANMACIAAALQQHGEDTIHFVQPAQWKRGMKLTKDKNRSLAQAKRRWPHSTIDWTVKANDGIAEAALMALWFATLRHQ